MRHRCGVLAGRWNSAEAEAGDGGGVGVRTHLERAQYLGCRGGLVAESKDEDAGLNLFGREQVEAASLLPQLDLCSGRGGERDIGQSVAERGVACLVEGSEPAVEQSARRCVRDEAHLVAEAWKVNENSGVYGADVASPATRYRSVSWIAEHYSIDLGWVVIVITVASRSGSGCG